MAMMEISVWKWLIPALFCFVDGIRRFEPIDIDDPREPRPVIDRPVIIDKPIFRPIIIDRPVIVDGPVTVDGPIFMVMFPSLIESGSDAKLCVSLLRLEESLTLTISLVDDKNTETQLVQQTSRSKLHRCFNFQAPQVSGDSVQTVRVVAQGPSNTKTEERKVMFRSYLPLTFIQTDKPLYNPGQTVNFRVVTMTDKLVPLDQMYNLVVLEDFRNIRINQWTSVSSTNWILELSHDLIPEAQVGTYTLKAYIGDRIISQSFDVKRYVLPKFDVTLNTPQTYSVADVGLKVEACAKYTFGQPVPGQVFVEVCRQPLTYIQDPKVTSVCQKKSTKTTGTGCASLTLSTSVFFGTSFESNLQNSFAINVTVTEEGTGVVMSKSTTVSITFEVGKVTFVDLPKFYDYGSTVNGKISVSDFNGNPINSKTVYLLDSSQWPHKLRFTLTTNENGLAMFSLDTTGFPKADLNLVASATPQAYYDYNSPYFTTDAQVVRLSRTAAPANPTFSDMSIVKLEQPLKCGTTYPVTVKYSFVGETGDYSADIIYMVMSRGVIVLHGFKTVQALASDTLTKGTVTFDLSVLANMAPMVQILVFCVLPSQTVVTGSASFDTEKCFSNQVSLQFSPATAVPGEGNILTVSAQAGSLCGLSAIDQSVLIVQSGGRLNAEAVFNLLPLQLLSNYPPGAEDQQNCYSIRSRRAVPTDQAYNTFKSVGIKIATNLPVRAPPCMMYKDLVYYPNFRGVVPFRDAVFAMAREPPAPVAMAEVAGGSSAVDVTIRTYFPETWIWQLAHVGDSGLASVPLTVPDTITTWDAEAFCLSSNGFGLAPPVLLTAFQPFFLELTLPYSIIRGELFELKATVFNYLSQCIKVQVTPTPSSNFTLKSLNDQYSSTLPANGRTTFKWALTASVIGTLNVTVSAEASPSQELCDNQVVTVPSRGRIDIVTRSLLVLAEGVERTFIRSWLLCPKGNMLSEVVKITFPKIVIQGSARCSVSVIGDIMGRALNNLANLLRMPSGCGEQNMIILAPNIYILRYLTVTAQLTPAIQDTATSYLQIGYQGELNYRHSDGSFSTFGYDPSNTWLTAFVMRTFGLARNFTYIDPNVLKSAKDWLISKQGSNGGFMQQGTLYHNDMKGGVGDDVTMTGYIVASLLEIGVPVTDPVITKALSFLRPLVGNLGNTYVTALLAYTFSLAGETNTRAQLLSALRNIAISEGTTLHWSQTTFGETLAVEISAYVLLAVLTVQPVTTANLGYANRIVNWLVAQQNPYGGFTSTQDTVVALQALALYAAQVYSPGGSITVTVQSSEPAGDVFNFAVTPNNRLLYQRNSLNNFPGTYSVVARGSACASVQVACFYNIPTPITVSKTLSVVAKVTGDCQAAPVNLMLTFTVQYTGPKPTTNMVLVDIKVLSGFTADTSLLGSPPNFAPLVQRVDSDGDHVLVYLQEVPKGVPVTFNIQLTRAVAVQNLKPAVINIYDYYQRNDKFETTYTPPCP
ncbi:LOW QUALITY PROTEIN: alpha-2-macroglobulin-like protein 1 [Danio aesculapii]|uniref:LOW QUALITY PROTEIN: alpha-2-macroglobulin-like protein 1 n=1 Tax=Danio aesculapii TaxID=1142201 RepID=UPI0024C08369|nr:LOW QUALITY PROTEIN: alpha-2-macroglobulin-like protein 1 [Danio aesculapii]